jgi:hypothetical protein
VIRCSLVQYIIISMTVCFASYIIIIIIIIITAIINNLPTLAYTTIFRNLLGYNFARRPSTRDE